jgi:hypothetical protein
MDLHGREMTYNAVDRSFCVVEGGTSEKMREWQKEMVETGMCYVGTAREGLSGADLEGEVFLRGLYVDE